uniref:Uncharacterized protein n=1 Tax=Meloidogyne incognita TaxID=6306 RepID=A0A914NDD1_MELIC
MNGGERTIREGMEAFISTEKKGETNEIHKRQKASRLTSIPSSNSCLILRRVNIP